MRRERTASELALLAAPITRAFDAAWRRMHWWIACMAVLYSVSGVTVIRPDEVAVVERWGRLVGDTPATRVHRPGLLFAFPRPMDRVVRVSVQRVQELSIRTLTPPQGYDVGEGNSLDPVTVGYALTGDLNVVHVAMVARYRVRDPAEWAFYGPESEAILRTEVTAAMVRSLGEMGVDHVLAEGRKSLIARATERAQAGLDAAHSGLALVSLELTRLAPPDVLAPDFDAVQTAYISAETRRGDAEAFAQKLLPRAQATANTALQAARADAAAALARAGGDAASFRALARAVRAHPGVGRERLYRDGVEKALGSAAEVRWIPPPSEGARERVRIQLSPPTAGNAPGPQSPTPAASPARPDQGSATPDATNSPVAPAESPTPAPGEGAP